MFSLPDFHTFVLYTPSHSRRPHSQAGSTKATLSHALTFNPDLPAAHCSGSADTRRGRRRPSPWDSPAASWPGRAHAPHRPAESRSCQPPGGELGLVGQRLRRGAGHSSKMHVPLHSPRWCQDPVVLSTDSERTWLSCALVDTGPLSPCSLSSGTEPKEAPNAQQVLNKYLPNNQ